MTEKQIEELKAQNAYLKAENEFLNGGLNKMTPCEFRQYLNSSY